MSTRWEPDRQHDDPLLLPTAALEQPSDDPLLLPTAALQQPSDDYLFPAATLESASNNEGADLDERHSKVPEGGREIPPQVEAAVVLGLGSDHRPLLRSPTIKTNDVSAKDSFLARIASIRGGVRPTENTETKATPVAAPAKVPTGPRFKF